MGAGVARVMPWIKRWQHGKGGKGGKDGKGGKHGKHARVRTYGMWPPSGCSMPAHAQGPSKRTTAAHYYQPAA